MVKVVCLAIPLVWTPLSNPSQTARDEQVEQLKAIASLRAIGVAVKIDEESPNKCAIEATIECWGSETNRNKNYAPLQTLKSLKRLKLAGLQVGDEVVRLVKDLSELESISLLQTSITDKGLAHLTKLPKLRELCIGVCSEISDDGFKHIGKMKKLEILWINNSSSKVTGSNIGALQGATKLHDLDLTGTTVTDKGVEALANHPSLRSLGLNGCDVTDGCLKYLEKMPKLRQVGITGDEAMKAGVKSFRLRHPEIEISYSSGGFF
jgi:hypothetical protein